MHMHMTLCSQSPHPPHVTCMSSPSTHTYIQHTMVLQAVLIEYKLSADEGEVKAAAYSTFCIIWKQLTPNVMIMKPMSDLCWVCQKNSMAIMRAANTPEAEKSQVIKDKNTKQKSYTHVRTLRFLRMPRHICS